MRVQTYPIKDFLCGLEQERQMQDFEKYLVECKKDKKRYLALVLLFASTMMILLSVAHYNIIPIAMVKLMMNILNAFSQLISIFMTLFGAIFIAKHILQFKNPISGFKIVMPIAFGITFSIYIARCLLNFLMIL